MGYPIVNQIDIVPTLASLLSFPIPKNNLGKVIIDLLKTEDGKQEEFCLYAYSNFLIFFRGNCSPGSLFKRLSARPTCRENVSSNQ